MDSSSALPPDIADAGLVVRTLEAKPRRTAEEEKTLNEARVRVAYWACRRAGIKPTRENLSFVMGPAAADLLERYDEQLRARAEQMADAAGLDADKASTVFWNGVKPGADAGGKPGKK